jgi:hypothetical protein
LYLAPEASADLINPQSAICLLVGRGYVEAAMTRWVNGEHIYGRTEHGVTRYGFLCRLDPPPPEIWEIRVTEPIERARLFGRFAEPDSFIMTGMRTRRVLGKRGSSDWAREMSSCEQSWRRFFPNHQPFSGKRMSDYATENCDDFEL